MSEDKARAIAKKLQRDIGDGKIEEMFDGSTRKHENMRQLQNLA